MFHSVSWPSTEEQQASLQLHSKEIKSDHDKKRRNCSNFKEMSRNHDPIDNSGKLTSCLEDVAKPAEVLRICIGTCTVRAWRTSTHHPVSTYLRTCEVHSPSNFKTCSFFKLVFQISRALLTRNREQRNGVAWYPSNAMSVGWQGKYVIFSLPENCKLLPRRYWGEGGL